MLLRGEPWGSDFRTITKSVKRTLDFFGNPCSLCQSLAWMVSLQASQNRLDAFCWFWALPLVAELPQRRPPQLDVAKCDFKLANSSALTSKMKSFGKRSGLRRTCSLRRRVSTPYRAASHHKSITIPRNHKYISVSLKCHLKLLFSSVSLVDCKRTSIDACRYENIEKTTYAERNICTECETHTPVKGYFAGGVGVACRIESHLRQ